MFVFMTWFVPWAGRTFFRVVKRCPWVFGLVAATGDAVGACILWIAPAGDWYVVVIAWGCLVFYTGLFVLLAQKLRAGTWGEFCDFGHEQFVD